MDNRPVSLLSKNLIEHCPHFRWNCLAFFFGLWWFFRLSFRTLTLSSWFIFKAQCFITTVCRMFGSLFSAATTIFDHRLVWLKFCTYLRFPHILVKNGSNRFFSKATFIIFCEKLCIIISGFLPEICMFSSFSDYLLSKKNIWTTEKPLIGLSNQRRTLAASNGMFLMYFYQVLLWI